MAHNSIKHTTLPFAQTSEPVVPAFLVCNYNASKHMLYTPQLSGGNIKKNNVKSTREPSYHEVNVYEGPL